MDLMQLAKNTINIERDALTILAESLDQRFQDSVALLSQCEGRIVITGIGKSAIVAQKIVATMNSTGTRSIFMHAADAVHGDLGMVDEKDVVICISKSGETSELKILIPILRSYKVKIVAMTSALQSYLAQSADELLYTPVDQEADPNQLAPTTSTTVQSSMGDAIAIVLLTQKGFTPSDFAKFHPGGSLGKQLYLQVEDLYINNGVPFVNKSEGIKDILLNISKHRLGATVVVDDNKSILGIITDGDVRRWFQRDDYQEGAFAQNVMTKNPKQIESTARALDAFQILRDTSISQLPVVKDGKYIGMIHINDLLREGFV